MAAKPGNTIALSATFTAEPLSETLEFWIERLHLESRLEYAAYNQVFQSLLDVNGIFAAANSGGVNVVLLRWQDLGQDEQQIASNAKSLIETIGKAASHFQSPIIIASCPGSPTFLESPSARALAIGLDLTLNETLAGVSGVHLLDSVSVAGLYSVNKIHEPLSERVGQIPYSAEYFAALGTMLVRKIVALRRQPFKVIAVDLDNTLWAGVVGEEGTNGVRIESNHLNLQEFLLKQRADGMLLVLCSKNNEPDAWEVFERRAEMLLKREHFAAWRIDWEPKSSNLRAISKELSLGLDSFIFIDDDAKECSEVMANIPEVLTLRLPENSQLIPTFIRHVWAFDRANITAEDKNRNESYQQERARAAVTETSSSLEDFIAALDLQVTIDPIRPEMLSRVSQLTQRTNQFNTTTIRRSESELKALLDGKTLECITVAVKDRFGDYGNVGAILYSFEGKALIVDSMLLSCRALGRGVEHQMIRHLGAEAVRRNATEIVIKFIASPKNTPALRFLDSLNAEWGSGGAFIRAFRITADAAQHLEYKAVAYADAVDKDKKEKSQLPPGQTQTTDYAVIATQLNSADAIRKAVRAANVKHPLTELSQTASANETPATEAPRNKTEEKLAEIWAEVLRVPVGIHDDFFECGGDSLRAVELLIRVSEEFDMPDLMLSMVLDAPTVARFAASLGKQKEVRCLIALRPTGNRTPIFCVPGGGGNVLSFRSLALDLPEDQPFWALQAPGLDGSEPVDDAKVVASMYLSEVRTVQSQGPYFLGGACYGGIIALEMAQQLTSQGEEVAFLALFETYNLLYGKMIPKYKAVFYHSRFLAQRIGSSLRRLSKTPINRWPDYLRRGFGNALRLAGKVYKVAISEAPIQTQARPAGPARRPDDIQVVDVLERVLKANMRAVERYVPEPYPGRMTLFRATQGLVEPYQDKYLGWKPIAGGGVELEIIPGRHSDFDTRLLAVALDRHLKRAQERTAQNAEPINV